MVPRVRRGQMGPSITPCYFENEITPSFRRRGASQKRGGSAPGVFAPLMDLLNPLLQIQTHTLAVQGLFFIPLTLPSKAGVFAPLMDLLNPLLQIQTHTLAVQGLFFIPSLLTRAGS
ncbi:hypothetical protein D3A96_05240 [Robertkochia marina]|nr:hypothetical protein D3A96_05240 [Robertkochia marina]